LNQRRGIALALAILHGADVIQARQPRQQREGQGTHRALLDIQGEMAQGPARRQRRPMPGQVLLDPPLAGLECTLHGLRPILQAQVGTAHLGLRRKRLPGLMARQIEHHAGGLVCRQQMLLVQLPADPRHQRLGHHHTERHARALQERHAFGQRPRLVDGADIHHQQVQAAGFDPGAIGTQATAETSIELGDGNEEIVLRLVIQVDDRSTGTGRHKLPP